MEFKKDTSFLVAVLHVLREGLASATCKLMARETPQAGMVLSQGGWTWAGQGDRGHVISLLSLLCLQPGSEDTGLKAETRKAFLKSSLSLPTLLPSHFFCGTFHELFLPRTAGTLIHSICVFQHV